MKYQVFIDKKVETFIKRQSKPQALRISNAISALAHDPRPPGCKQLKGQKNEYRLRIGDVRILYTIEDAIVTVYVFKAGYRGDVYK